STRARTSQNHPVHRSTPVQDHVKRAQSLDLGKIVMADEVKTNILIVDDVPDKLLAFEAILADLGQNVVTVGSGRDALRRLLHEEFAVILLDVNMPIMDGLETASLIRQRKKSEH